MALFQKTDGSGVLVLAAGDNIAVATSELPAGTAREITLRMRLALASPQVAVARGRPPCRVMSAATVSTCASRTSSQVA